MVGVDVGGSPRVDVIPGGEGLPVHPIRQHPHHRGIQHWGRNRNRVPQSETAEITGARALYSSSSRKPSPPRPGGVACLAAKDALDERGRRRQSVRAGCLVRLGSKGTRKAAVAPASVPATATGLSRVGTAGVSLSSASPFHSYFFPKKILFLLLQK